MPSSMKRTVKPLPMEGGSPFLPDDIMVNILKRLSVKSLIQLQCVCKHWKNLIKEPSFVAEHLHHSSHQTPLLLLLYRRFRSPGLCWVLLDCEMRELVVQSSPLIDSLPYLYINGSSNGLLCLKSESLDFILLWNPATREIRMVPMTINDLEGRCNIGFGFSPIVNDYKIVVIYEQHDAKGWQMYRVEVYSLCAKSWKEVEFGNLEGLNVSADTVSVSGDVFWFGYKGVDVEENGYCSVVSFDIANEVFTLIPMPAAHGSSEQKLTVHENKLAILCVKRHTKDEYCIKLWVMEEGSGTFGERWSFAHKHTRILGPDLSMLYPLTISGNEVICEPEFEYESDSDPEGEDDDDPTISLYLYNLASNEFKTFVIHGCDKDNGILMHNYVESLVSIENIHVQNP